jgi:hemerythrin
MIDIQWKKEYEIGHYLLDTQHKYLFELSNQIFKSNNLLGLDTSFKSFS